MRNIFKRLGVLAINSRANNFTGAVIRLTVYYTVGVFVILTIFSALVYGLFTLGIVHELKEDVPVNDRNMIIDERSSATEVADDLFDVLLLSDSILLALTVVVSYLLARKTLAPLADSYQKQRRFVGDAAHELRTPLSVLKAGSELLLQHERKAHEYKKFILESQDEINRLITLSNDLLFLTQHSEVVPQNYEELSISQVAEKQYEHIRSYAQMKGITIEAHIEPDVRIKGKYDDFARLVLNLLKNAIDYNTPNGTVTLTLDTKQGNIVLAISDTGIGIAPSDVPHIFERFYKADASRTQSESTGCGLGLAIVSEIVTRYKGTIDVSSTLGKGTTFTVQFPYA